MTRRSIAWGFLAAGFAAPGVAMVTSWDQGTSAGLLAAALWCAILALAEWQPKDGGE